MWLHSAWTALLAQGMVSLHPMAFRISGQPSIGRQAFLEPPGSGVALPGVSPGELGHWRSEVEPAPRFNPPSASRSAPDRRYALPLIRGSGPSPAPVGRAAPGPCRHRVTDLTRDSPDSRP